MSAFRARRLCPDAIFLAPRHHLYTEVSEKLYDLMTSYTPLVEPLSVDEAFMDVTGSVRLFGEPEAIAHDIRRRVFEDLGLTCSVGIAPVKFLAKLASEAAKPRVAAGKVSEGYGVFRVRRGEELRFLHPLPVQALWGVGPATLARLERLGIGTVGDLAALDESVLVSALGSAHGAHLYALAHAHDERDVVPDRVAKSIGHEETFEQDLYSVEELRPHVVRLADAVARRLRRADTSAATLTLKVKFSTFNVVTRSVTLSQALTTGPAIVTAIMPLVSDIDPAQGFDSSAFMQRDLASRSTTRAFSMTLMTQSRQSKRNGPWRMTRSTPFLTVTARVRSGQRRHFGHVDRGVAVRPAVKSPSPHCVQGCEVERFGCGSLGRRTAHSAGNRTTARD